MTDAIVARFLALVGAGRLAEVAAALDQMPGLANAAGPHPYWGGRPQALHLAVEARRRDMFDLLLARGADPSGVNGGYDHWSPLMLAIDREADDMRDDLLHRGARVGLLDALLLADDAAVARILGDGPLPAIAPNGGSILAFARTPWAIDHLLALGASSETKDRWGSTPIDAMSRRGPAGQPLVAHLISRGVPAAPKEYARLGDLERLREIASAEPSAVREDAVMMGAVDFGHHALVSWLLAHDAPVQARSDAQSRHTALHSAAWNGDLQMVKLLLAAGADPAARDEQYDGTPAGWAETAIEVTNNPRCAEVAAYLASLRDK